MSQGFLSRFQFGAAGTHFGGSLFAMTDPFFMIMMMKNLGPDYVVWDKEATVRFLKPVRGTVTARFQLPEERIAEARALTESGARHEPVFRVEIVDTSGNTVADVAKTLHIRKRHSREGGNPGGTPARASSGFPPPRE